MRHLRNDAAKSTVVNTPVPTLGESLYLGVLINFAGISNRSGTVSIFLPYF